MKKCLFCGKVYQPRHPKQKFCCPKCRQKAEYFSDLLKEDEEIKKIVEKRGERKEEQEREAYIFRDWSIKEKDCAEAWAFIKTIKPIDFKELFSWEKVKPKKEWKKHYNKRG